MDSRTLTDLISIPLFTGVLGYLTNWTGVLMLFKPLRFYGIPVPGLRTVSRRPGRWAGALPLVSHAGAVGWQGIIPARADTMARTAMDLALGTEVGGAAELYRELEPERIADRLAALAQPQIRGVVEQIARTEHPQLWRDLPVVAREGVHARVQSQLPRIVEHLAAELGGDLSQFIDARQLVTQYFHAHPEQLNELFTSAGRRELRFIQNFGFYFGVPMGFVLFAIVQVYPRSWVLPVGGVLIGGAVNYLGLTMLFAPVHARRWIPWHQALLVRRQPEVGEQFAASVADNVMTVDNIAADLLTGLRSERTMRLLHSTLRPAVGTAIGPARAAVRAAIGSREFDQLRLSAGADTAQSRRPAVDGTDLEGHQVAKVRRFLALRMHKLAPDEFVALLRSGIGQDEWLLLVHGGLLGLLAGLLHLTLFGG
jgi:uncharacterized membrane protein YheB (UPF0754 family)